MNEEELIIITCDECKVKFTVPPRKRSGTPRRLCDECRFKHKVLSSQENMIPVKYCPVCRRPMAWRHMTAHTGRCLNLYNSGNHKIGKETQKDMQKVFSYDEASVML